ncbi:helix-turn-helix domain-containing protein [Bradyrhizobium genosp. P]|uniref:helix-turn-helix domain-containing protein n=1 Tax=Bradyrhizobium genosp. P TaxID=83641 RepID=UPI003CF34309
MPKIDPLSLTINETVGVLRVSRAKVYQLLSEKKLTARRDGQRTLVDYASVMAHHASRKPFVSGAPMANARGAER